MEYTTSPTLDQLHKMKELISGCGMYQVLIDEKFINSTDNFLIWDDDSQLLHAISANIEVPSQYYAPFKIRSYDYSIIERIIAIYSDNEEVIYEKEV